MSNTLIPIGEVEVVPEDERRTIEDWKLLDPCPNCGSRPHDAPEGLQRDNETPAWNFAHCWRCGYRPGVNAGNSVDVLQQRYAEFKEFFAQQLGIHPTLMPPDPSQIAALTEGFAKMQDELRAVRENQVAQLQQAPRFDDDEEIRQLEAEIRKETLKKQLAELKGEPSADASTEVKTNPAKDENGGS